LKLTESRGGVRLAIAFTRGHPRLDIKLLHLALAHVARTDVQDAVGEFEQFQHVFGVLDDLLVKSFGFLIVRAAQNHLLDLFEDVNPVESVRVLAGRTRFPSEAGAGGDIFLWQFFF